MRKESLCYVARSWRPRVRIVITDHNSRTYDVITPRGRNYSVEVRTLSQMN